MRRSDFHYELPPGQIAQRPLPERSASRLLCLDRLSGATADRGMRELSGLLAPGDLLVFNDTRVIPARLYGRKASGGAVELLVERVLGARRFSARLRASKTPKPGGELMLGDGGVRATVADRDGELFTIELADTDAGELLESHGHVPLPPYIQRADEPFDRERYQTLWALRDGAVAAPTAGLHFDEALLDRLRERRFEFGYVTLHVGSGTYQRVRAEDLSQHRLHAERIEVDEALCRQVAETRERGGRVVAVGTTVVRSLETAARGKSELRPYAGETDLFITPGYRFHAVDALLTNFHEPESTLLMLVCAFGGREAVLDAYRHAVAENYRFLSYGDAMFIG